MFEHRPTRGRSARHIVGMVALGIVIAAALGGVVMGLWNALLPSLFGLKAIHFWQAIGLLILSRILFGGFHRCGGRRFHHRQHLIERWERMTPEERERFKQGFRSRFCGGPASSQG